MAVTPSAKAKAPALPSVPHLRGAGTWGRPCGQGGAPLRSSCAQHKRENRRQTAKSATGSKICDRQENRAQLFRPGGPSSTVAAGPDSAVTPPPGPHPPPPGQRRHRRGRAGVSQRDCKSPFCVHFTLLSPSPPRVAPAGGAGGRWGGAQGSAAALPEAGPPRAPRARRPSRPRHAPVSPPGTETPRGDGSS